MQNNQIKPILTKLQILQIKKSFSLKKTLIIPTLPCSILGNQRPPRFHKLNWLSCYYNVKVIISSIARKLALAFELAQMFLLYHTLYYKCIFYHTLY